MSKLQTIAAVEPQFATEEFFMVRDLLATQGSRTHELVDYEDSTVSKRFNFAGKDVPIKVPFKFAMCLLGKEGFELTNSKGEIIRPRKDQKDTVGQEVTLAVNEVIAKLDELTADALAERVIKVGGTKGKKEEMIAFLIASNGGPSDYAPLTGNSQVNDEAEDELFDEDDLAEDDLLLED